MNAKTMSKFFCLDSIEHTSIVAKLCMCLSVITPLFSNIAEIIAENIISFKLSK